VVYFKGNSSVDEFGIFAPLLIVEVRLVKDNSKKLLVGEGFDDKSRFSR
jgi:hypothetical protein